MKDIKGSALAALGLAAGLALAVPAQAQDAECGTDRTIDIAKMTWASAAALAEIHAKILGDGYGCDVEVVAGDTVPTSASMLSRGSPAVAPELWTSSIQEQWEKGIEEGQVVTLGDAIDGGAIEGWFIPEYFKQEHPELVTAQDVVDNPQLFPDPEQPDQGRLYGCPPGWACELANAALFEAYEMDGTWNLFSPGSGGNLSASIARAFEREEPILFYYWGPTAVLGKYDTYQLEMPEVDIEGYRCNTNTDCEDPAIKTAWPSSPVKVGAAGWVAEEAPNVADYFSKVAVSDDVINSLLAWSDENNADAEETAVNFIENNEDIWTTWVPEAVAEKVRASL